MNFNQNLISLRKQNQMSQDALAERLNVSRQTIYKWETGATYPDMDKLMDIANLFNVSVDKLINDEIVEDTVSNDEVVKRYKSFSTAIATGVFMIMFGVALMVVLADRGDIAEAIGLISMLSLIFISVIVFVFSTLNFEAFKKENNISDIEVSKKQLSNARNAFTKALIVGLALIFIGIIQLIIFAFTDNDSIVTISVSVLLVLIGAGVWSIVRYSMMFELFDKPQKALKHEVKDDENHNPACAIIMIAAIIVFVIWGFVFDGWRICWISFVVGALLCGIVAILTDKKNKTIE